MNTTPTPTPKSIITHPITAVSMSAAALIISIATAITLLLTPTTTPDQPAEQPAAQPAEQPAAQPAEQPAEQPAAGESTVPARLVTKQVKSRDPQCGYGGLPVCTAIGVHNPAAA